MESAQKGFDAIFNDWIHNVSWIDIYLSLLEWIDTYKEFIQSKDEIADILRRAASGLNEKDILEDFIYGAQYDKLRIEFGH